VDLSCVLDPFGRPRTSMAKAGAQRLALPNDQPGQADHRISLAVLNVWSVTRTLKKEWRVVDVKIAVSQVDHWSIYAIACLQNLAQRRGYESRSPFTSVSI